MGSESRARKSVECQRLLSRATTVSINSGLIVCSRSDRQAPSLTEEDTGSPKKDIFDWASWVYSLMTRDNPLYHGLDHMDMMAKSDAISERQQKVKHREFSNWPRIDDNMLGSVMLKAWEGQYESAAEVLEDTRETLERHGTRLSSGCSDEIIGIDWRQEFAIGTVDEDGRQRYMICARQKALE